MINGPSEENCDEGRKATKTSPNSTGTGVRAMLNPLSWVIAIFGLYFPHPGAKCPSAPRRWFRVLYCLVCNGLVWSQTVRYGICLTKFISVDEDFLLQASFFLQMTWASLLISVFTATSFSAWPKFLNRLQNIHDLYGCPVYIKHGRKKLLVVMLFCVGSTLGLQTSWYYAQLTSEEVQSGRHCVMFPFQINQTIPNYSFVAFHLFASYFATLDIVIVQLVVFVLCYILCKEFVCVARRLRKILNCPEDGEVSASVENVRRQYEDVVSLLENGNRLLSVFFLTEYCMMIPYVCLTVYALRTAKYSTETVFVSYSGSTSLLALAAVITACGILINSQAHGLVDDILRVDFTRLSEMAARSLSVFLARLTGTNVGLSAGGLFIVDKSAFLAVAGALITYLIVVIQFQPKSSDPPAQSYDNSTTF